MLIAALSAVAVGVVAVMLCRNPWYSHFRSCSSMTRRISRTSSLVTQPGFLLRKRRVEIRVGVPRLTDGRIDYLEGGEPLSECLEDFSTVAKAQDRGAGAS